MNIEKTVVQVFQNAGRNRQIDFFYRNITLSYTKCFIYLGLALSTRLSPHPHIERNIKNVRKNIGALNKTTPIRKFDFDSASRLLKSVFIPTGFYGLDCFNPNWTIRELSDQSYKIRGTFYKYWASLPIYTSNHHLTDLIENSDPLSIKTAPIGTRKLIGLLYSDALHKKLCCTTKCFRQPKPTERVPNPPTCICKLCGDNLSLLHPTTCTAFPPNTPPPPMERIKTLWFNSYSLIPMI